MFGAENVPGGVELDLLLRLLFLEHLVVAEFGLTKRLGVGRFEKPTGFLPTLLDAGFDRRGLFFRGRALLSFGGGQSRVQYSAALGLCGVESAPQGGNFFVQFVAMVLLESVQFVGVLGFQFGSGVEHFLTMNGLQTGFFDLERGFELSVLRRQLLVQLGVELFLPAVQTGLNFSQIPGGLFFLRVQLGFQSGGDFAFLPQAGVQHGQRLVELLFQGGVLLQGSFHFLVEFFVFLAA